MAVVQIGARRHYAVARGLNAIESLEILVADACVGSPPWSWLSHLPGQSQIGGLVSILSRNTVDIPRAKIRGKLAFFLSNEFRKTRNARLCWAADRWTQQNEDFCRAINEKDWRGADTVYAYNGAAFEVFTKAKSLGLRCILDQTAAAWRYNTRLLRKEQEDWPEWETYPADLDAGGRMTEREEREWEIADRIVCGSQFVVDSIRDVGGPVEKCRVVPYPMPTTHEPPGEQNRRAHSRCRVLFVGSLQLRKGVQYLWEAAGLLPSDRYEFRAIGPSNLTPLGNAYVQERVDWRGPVLRAAVWDHYTWADVFVLPTLSEGSANVCHEALSIGLPVITTPAAGIASRRGGLHRTPASDSHALADALERVRSARPERLPVVPSQRSITDYGRDLVAAMID